MLELEVLTPRLVWSYYYRGCQQWGLGSHHRSDPPLRPASADTLDDSHQVRSDSRPIFLSGAGINVFLRILTFLGKIIFFFRLMFF